MKRRRGGSRSTMVGGDEQGAMEVKKRREQAASGQASRKEGKEESSSLSSLSIVLSLSLSLSLSIYPCNGLDCLLACFPSCPMPPFPFCQLEKWQDLDPARFPSSIQYHPTLVPLHGSKERARPIDGTNPSVVSPLLDQGSTLTVRAKGKNNQRLPTCPVIPKYC